MSESYDVLPTPPSREPSEEQAKSRAMRTVHSPSLGARLGVLVALLLLVAAGYFLLAPLQRVPATGSPVRCGNALERPTGSLGRSLCGNVNLQRQYLAGSLAVSAAVVGVGGFLVFGSTRRVERLRLGADS